MKWINPLKAVASLFADRPLSEFEKAERHAATLLPPTVPLKAPKGGGASVPAYRTGSVAATAVLPKKNFDVANLDLTAAYRTGASTQTIVRNLARFNPETAASMAANSRVGIPEKYIAIARNPDGSFNRDATQLALQILRQMNTMADYSNGFSHVSTLRSVSEALAKEMQVEGAMALELVLDKSRLPLKFAPVAISTIQFYEEDTGLNPVQKVGGVEIDLDIPTFFYTALDPSLLDAYAQSPLESAVQPILASTTFLSDLRRLCGRHVYQRYDITLVEDKIRERIPAEIMNDENQRVIALNGLLAEVEAAITDLGVDEALVHFDFFEIKYIEGGTGEVPATFDTVNNIYSGKIATATKTPPSVLGMGAKSATSASTETLMFMVNANGMIRLKLQELYSKAMTLAVRLFGLDVTVEFEFDDIELRPAGELEAYRAMKLERITTQLSLGFITDDEACLRLTGQLTPVGYTVKMGTMWKTTTAAPAANPDSQTSNLGANKNKTPTAPKGPA